MLAGRISYVFGLFGPCLAIDTACSSGLVALGSAHNALMLGTASSALAGGVNLLLSPSTHAMYSVAGEAWLLKRPQNGLSCFIAVSVIDLLFLKFGL